MAKSRCGRTNLTGFPMVSPMAEGKSERMHELMSVAPVASSVARALQATRETRGLELGPAALGRTPDVFRQFFPRKPALIVADTTTFAVAGQRVLDALRHAGCACREIGRAHV